LEDKPLNPAIGEALRLWHGSTPDARFVTLRGYEQLPARCGFDLDVIVSPAHVIVAVEAAIAAGRTAGLLAYVQLKSASSAKVIWFVPTVDHAHRQWLLIDIGSRLVFGTHRITLDEIETETWTHGDFELDVPRADWRATFHELRKLVANDERPDLPSRAGDLPKLGDVVGKANAAAFFAALDRPTPGEREDAVLAWCNELGFRKPTAQTSDGNTPVRARLSRLIFFRLPFWERHRPRFIVVTGPDGVGKTTLISQLQELLDQYPMDFDNLHHLGATKATGWSQGAADKPGDSGAQRIGIARRAARLVWRHLLPETVKAAVVGIAGEFRYAARLNRLIGTAFFAGRATLMDRYVFDRLTRLEIDQRHRLQQWAGRLICRFMRRPRLTILLSDDPQRIHARKDQLSIEIIDAYQQRIRALIADTHTPMVELPVSGRSPADLAGEALGLILDALDTDVPTLVASWDRAHRSENASTVSYAGRRQAT
jgi:thymidylate kinase